MNSKIKKVINKFIEKTVPVLKPKSIVLIGSSLIETEDVKDIDIVIMLKEKTFLSPTKSLLLVKKFIKLVKFKTVGQIGYIYDKENPRIELRVVFEEKIFDLVFTDSSVFVDIHNPEVSKDNFELYIGNLFAHGKVLYEKDCYHSKLSERYIPYYDEKFRKKRLILLTNEIKERIKRIKTDAQKNRIINAIYNLDKVLQMLVQLIFIKSKIYPLSYTKRIDFQFGTLLGEGLYLEKINKILDKDGINQVGLINLANKINDLI